VIDDPNGLRPSDGRDAHVRSAAGLQFARFLVVGVGNTVVSFVAYRLLLLFGVPYALAAPLAFAVGALNGYVFNRTWTFAARDTTRARVLYVAFQAAGAGATSLLVVILVDAGIGHSLAYLASIPPVTIGLFLANRLLTFSDRG
jgi:putative flippase GtrA